MPELEIIMKKYPNAILTLNSAFYYYGLTDTIPDHYYVATPKSNRKIEDVRVKLSFDLYKEIISNYSKLIHKMDMTQIMEYAYDKHGDGNYQTGDFINDFYTKAD